MAFSLIKNISDLVRRQDSSSLGRTVRDVVVGSVTPVDPPQMAYLWEVSFDGLFSDEASNLTFYARGTGIPAIMVESIKRFYAGQEYAYSGKDNSPRIFRVTFWDNQNLDVYHYFQKWMFTMNDPVARRKVNPQNYLRRIVLRMKDTTDLIVNEEFVFDGCFPTEISEATLAYDNSDVMTFDVLFHFNQRFSGGNSGVSLQNILGGL